jgi:hypothetical protein
MFLQSMIDNDCGRKLLLGFEDTDHDLIIIRYTVEEDRVVYPTLSLNLSFQPLHSLHMPLHIHILILHIYCHEL